MNFHGIWDSEVFSLCKTGLEIIRNRLARFSFFDSLRANQEFHASLCIFGNPGIGPVVLSALLDGLEPLYQYGDIVLIEIKQALYTIFPEFIHSVTEFLRTRRPRRGDAANDAASCARADRAGVLSIWLFSIGLGVLMLFARDPQRALACAAGWLVTSVWLVAKAKPGDSPKWALVPTLCVFATIAGFHVLWAATPRSWTDPASWTLIASIAETLLASAVLFLRHAIASRRPRRLLCAGVVLATLALWCATVETIVHYIVC